MEGVISVDHARASAFFAAAANVTRLKILCELCDGELSATELCQRIDIASVSLFQHLTVLRRARLVRKRKTGVHVFYRLEPGITERLMLLVHRNFNLPSEQ